MLGWSLVLLSGIFQYERIEYLRNVDNEVVGTIRYIGFTSIGKMLAFTGLCIEFLIVTPLLIKGENQNEGNYLSKKKN